MPGAIRATAVNRTREYPDELYCDNGILLCKSVDTKQSTIAAKIYDGNCNSQQ